MRQALRGMFGRSSITNFETHRLTCLPVELEPSQVASLQPQYTDDTFQYGDFQIHVAAVTAYPFLVSLENPIPHLFASRIDPASGTLNIASITPSDICETHPYELKHFMASISGEWMQLICTIDGHRITPLNGISAPLSVVLLLMSYATDRYFAFRLLFAASSSQTIIILLDVIAGLDNVDLLADVLADFIDPVVNHIIENSGGERPVINAAARVVEQILERDNLDLDQVDQFETIDKPFTPQQAGVLLGIMWGGMLKFVSKESIDYKARINRTKSSAHLVLESLAVVRLFVDVVAFKDGLEYLCENLKDPKQPIGESIKKFLLDVITWPSLKSQRITGNIYTEEEVHTLFVWLRTSLVSCGFYHFV